MTKLRTVTACHRARKHTRLRARCIVLVAKTERMLFDTRNFLNSIKIRRPQ